MSALLALSLWLAPRLALADEWRPALEPDDLPGASALPPHDPPRYALRLPAALGSPVARTLVGWMPPLSLRGAPATLAAVTPSLREDPPPPSWRSQQIAGAILLRETVRPFHIAFGIATWAAMAATTVLGAIQLYDRFGFWSSASDTPCARHDSVMGFCGSETPWPHLIAGVTTAVLYTTTFSLSFLMPDPLHVAREDSPRGERVRVHRTLRWVHLAGMVLLTALGAIGASGLDYDSRRALAWAHSVTALATFGVLTADAALILF